MTNEELVKQFYDGDKAALHALYEQNTGFIHETVNAAAKQYRLFTVTNSSLIGITSTSIFWTSFTLTGLTTISSTLISNMFAGDTTIGWIFNSTKTSFMSLTSVSTLMTAEVLVWGFVWLSWVAFPNSQPVKEKRIVDAVIKEIIDFILLARFTKSLPYKNAFL